MNEETQLKLLAYVDGELPANEKSGIEALIAKDSEAADLVAELRWSHEAMTGTEVELKVPESRDFYWSKISRQIEFEGKQAERSASSLSDKWWYKMLIPTAGVAAIALVLTFTARPPVSQDGTGAAAPTTSEPVFEDANVYEYYDEQEKMSVIWVTTDDSNELDSPKRDPLADDDQLQ